jgi:branched-chain amino acid transport system ATP-binding protein
MLVLDKVSAAYGYTPALFDISLEVPDGKIVTLLGRNGMGKTTSVRAIMGLMEKTGGSIRFNGREVRGLPSEQIARTGIGLVPEGRHVFPTLTVWENLVATAANRLGHKQAWNLDRVWALFPRLRERSQQIAGSLSGGEQQMLSIGRALMTNPKLLILDEATEGLAPVIRAEIWSCIENLKNDRQSILLIDKNLHVLRRLADHHYIVEKGRIVWSGDNGTLEANGEVALRYVGV